MRALRTHPPEPALLVLVSLASGPKHGYAMMADIESFSAIRVGPGSLYGAIERLDKAGLIEAVDSTERRRPYRLTPRGQEMLGGQLSALDQLAKLGRRRLAER